MSLRDEALTVARQTGKGPSCTVGKMFARMDDDLATEVRDVMADNAIPMSALAAALKARGIDGVPRAQTLARHHRGECSCG